MGAPLIDHIVVLENVIEYLKHSNKGPMSTVVYIVLQEQMHSLGLSLPYVYVEIIQAPNIKLLVCVVLPSK